IAVEWAMLERELEEVLRLLLAVDIMSGRIMAHDMRARTRIEAATLLIEARGHDDLISKSLFDEFVKIGSHISNQLHLRRDLVVHGLWNSRKRAWCVLRMKAKRQTPKGLPRRLQKLSRPVIPEPVPFDRKKLNDLVDEIVDWAKRVEAFCGKLKGALPQSQ